MQLLTMSIDNNDDGCWEWTTFYASITRRMDSETKQTALTIIVRCQSLTVECVSGGLRFSEESL